MTKIWMIYLGAHTSNPKTRDTTAAKKPPPPLGHRRPPRIKPGPSQSPKTNTNIKRTDLSQKRIHANMPIKSSFYDLKSRSKSSLICKGFVYMIKSLYYIII